jgi:hypothetical protein
MNPSVKLLSSEYKVSLFCAFNPLPAIKTAIIIKTIFFIFIFFWLINACKVAVLIDKLNSKATFPLSLSYLRLSPKQKGMPPREKGMSPRTLRFPPNKLRIPPEKMGMPPKEKGVSPKEKGKVRNH